MRTFLAALTLLILGTGCSFFGFDDSGGNVQIAELVERTDSTETVRLEAGEGIQLTLVDARLRFVGKSQDSRCPTGVTCFWEGEIVARLEFTPVGGETATLDVQGYVGPEGDGRLMAATDGVQLTLVRLDPYPAEGETQDGVPDVATIRVARR